MFVPSVNIGVDDNVVDDASVVNFVVANNADVVVLSVAIVVDADDAAVIVAFGDVVNSETK